MAFFFSIRLRSALEMNQRLLRTSLNTPLRVTTLRNRLNIACWDSFDLGVTLGMMSHLLSYGA
jgi:hypothetical protein